MSKLQKTNLKRLDTTLSFKTVKSVGSYINSNEAKNKKHKKRCL